MAAYSEQHRPATSVVSLGRPPRETGSSLNPPITLTSTYVGSAVPQPGDRVYARFSNESWEPLEPELTVLVPRTRAAELSQYLTHLSRYRGRNDMLHALDRDHPVLYPGKLLHKLLHRHTSRFLNMP